MGMTAAGGPGSQSSTITSAGARRSADVLRDARVFVVEDEFIVAALLEERLRSLGCDVVGPAATVAEALELLAVEPVDVAVLDVNIAGEKVFPVADALEARGIPFVFATAYGAAGIDDRHGGKSVLDKPYHERALEHALRAAVQGRRR
jgi:CheY-like chemotaxis protein